MHTHVYVYVPIHLHRRECTFLCICLHTLIHIHRGWAVLWSFPSDDPHDKKCQLTQYRWQAWGLLPNDCSFPTTNTRLRHSPVPPGPKPLSPPTALPTTLFLELWATWESTCHKHTFMYAFYRNETIFLLRTKEATSTWWAREELIIWIPSPSLWTVP